MHIGFLKVGVLECINKDIFLGWNIKKNQENPKIRRTYRGRREKQVSANEIHYVHLMTGALKGSTA